MIGIEIRRIWVAALVFLASCTSTFFIGRPTVTQLTAEPPIFLLAYPLAFTVGEKNEPFEVPAGFVTDLASIPRALWWWEAPHEGTLAPAIVHDFLYWEQPCTKDEADAVMYVAMTQTGMSEFAINRVYDGIRTRFARDAWERNANARLKGEPRFFTAFFTSWLIAGRLDSKVTLATIQSEAIKKNGVLKPMLPLARIKAVCKAALGALNASRAL